MQKIDMTWHDMTWHDMTWHHIIPYRILPYNMALYNLNQLNSRSTNAVLCGKWDRAAVLCSKSYRVHICVGCLPSSSLPTLQLGRVAGREEDLWIQIVRWTDIQWFDDSFCHSLHSIRVASAESVGCTSVLKFGVMPTSKPTQQLSWYMKLLLVHIDWFFDRSKEESWSKVVAE